MSLAAPLAAHAQDAHKPGGLNKVAHDVSNTFKHAGRSAKSTVHGAASSAHGDLTTAGKNAKASVKDSTKP